MVTWDSYRVDAHEAKLRPKHLQPADVQGVKLESDLHDQIEAELKRRRWYYVHSRTDKKTTNQLGVPDFVIAANDGRVFWIELKRQSGKLTTEQNIAKHCLLALGHRYKTIFSFNEFINFISAD